MTKDDVRAMTSKGPVFALTQEASQICYMPPGWIVLHKTSSPDVVVGVRTSAMSKNNLGEVMEYKKNIDKHRTIDDDTGVRVLADAIFQWAEAGVVPASAPAGGE